MENNLNKMKQILKATCITLIGVLAYLLIDMAVRSAERPIGLSRTDRIDTPSYHKFECEGHTYIQFRPYVDEVAIVHDPECPHCKHLNH